MTRPRARTRTAVSTTAAGCDAAEIGGWIGRHPPFPDAVLVSPAVRAQQTWEIAREAMKDASQAPQPQVELLAELYGADPAQLLQIIRMAEAADPEAADAGRPQSRHA